MVGGAAAVVLAVHGILAPVVRGNWTSELASWVDEVHGGEVAVVSDRYLMGVGPRLNWLRNRVLAMRMVNLVLPFSARGKAVHIVAHSNGAAIALRVAELLAGRGVRVESMVLVAGAVSCDVVRSGVVGLQRRGMLGRAVSFWSGEDGLRWVPGLFYWPYGRLASTGWRKGGEVFTSREVFSVEHVGYSHSEYWDEGVREGTFERVWACLFGEFSERRVG